MDKVSRKTRSEIMAKVRSTRNRSTEWKLRSALVRTQLTGWRITVTDLPGNPDFVFPEKRVAIFVDGCFWHGCPRCGRFPKSRRTYWNAKISGNIQRDRRNRRKLRSIGWRVIRVWEHELKNGAMKVASRIRAAL